MKCGTQNGILRGIVNRRVDRLFKNGANTSNTGLLIQDCASFKTIVIIRIQESYCW